MKAFMLPAFLILALCPAIAMLSCSAPATPKTPATMTAEEAKKALRDQGIHYSTTTFFQAVGREDLDEVTLFVVAGMDANQRSKHGDTALMRAAYFSDTAMAHLLLANGADVTVTSEFSGAALIIAAERNNLELVEEFLARGAEVNVANADGHTPLMFASMRGNAAMVTALLEHGASLDANVRGSNAAQLAANNGHREVVTLLNAAAKEKRKTQRANDTPEKPSDHEQAEAPEPAEQTTAPSEAPPVHDDHFKVVVFGIPENLPYDTRLFDVMIPATIEAFAAADYPAIGEVEEAYKALHADPSKRNGKAMEEIFNAFAEPFDEAESEKFRDLYFDVVAQQMTVMSAKVAEETLDELRSAFSQGSHPLLDAVALATEAFTREPNDEGEANVAKAIEAFEAALNEEDRAESQSIRETTAERLMAGDPDEMERIVIDGWVADLERNRDWINSEIGAVVAPDAFDEIAENMSYSEVESVVGREGNQTASLTFTINGAETTTLQYVWSWPTESGTQAGLVVWFLNGQLRLKSYNEIPN